MTHQITALRGGSFSPQYKTRLGHANPSRPKRDHPPSGGQLFPVRYGTRLNNTSHSLPGSGQGEDFNDVNVARPGNTSHGTTALNKNTRLRAGSFSPPDPTRQYEATPVVTEPLPGWPGRRFSIHHANRTARITSSRNSPTPNHPPKGGQLSILNSTTQDIARRDNTTSPACGRAAFPRPSARATSVRRDPHPHKHHRPSGRKLSLPGKTWLPTARPNDTSRSHARKSKEKPRLGDRAGFAL
jgi:hypothetical protein